MLRRQLMLLLLTIGWSCSILNAYAANIMMITMGGTKSHKIPFWALARALTGRGHHVTFVNGFQADFHMDGLVEVTPKRFVQYVQNYTNWDLVGARYAGRAPLTLSDAMRYPIEACNSLLSDPATRHLLRLDVGGATTATTATTGTSAVAAGVATTTDACSLDKVKGKGCTGGRTTSMAEAEAEDEEEAVAKPTATVSYDLAIVDGAFPECALGIVHRLNVTAFIYINTVGFYTGSVSLAGNPVAYAVTPHVFTAWTQRMHFLQRVGNCVTHVFADLLHRYCTWRVHRVLQQQLGEATPHPYELGSNVAFILQNGHASLSYPRPYQPNVAEVACLHCRAPLNLSSSSSGEDVELAQFLNAAPAGAIFLSMGSSVRSARLPAALRQLFVSVFARLPRHHVVWTWAGNATQLLPALPPNVRVRAWLPQQDILGHGRLKLFISHGGLLSIHEAVYHGVPLVVLPVFCDHDVNAAKAVQDGYARQLELAQLTEEALYCAVYDVLHNDSYRRAVRRRRSLLLDQLAQPLRTAVHWTEYVIRHRGAPHLQPAGRHLNYFSYHSLDVLCLLLAAALALLCLLRCCLCRCRRRKRHKTKTV